MDHTLDPIPDMKPRVIFSQSKMITEQIASGQKWGVIKKVVSIIITDYKLVPENAKYHNQFRYRAMDGTEFSGLTEINTLELTKLPAESDESELWYWTKFIKSDDVEALDMIAEKSPQIKKAVGVLKELSADERTRMIYEDREKARRDIASMVDGAEQKGRREQSIEFARKLLKRNRPIEEIIEDTGLAREEIESLQTAI